MASPSETDRDWLMESPRPDLRSSAAEGIAREGMVTVWDELGRYLGCMGVETWKQLLRDAARAA